MSLTTCQHCGAGHVCHTAPLLRFNVFNFVRQGLHSLTASYTIHASDGYKIKHVRADGEDRLYITVTATHAEMPPDDPYYSPPPERGTSATGT